MIYDSKRDAHMRLAELAAYHYHEPGRGITKTMIAGRVKLDAEKEGIILSDGAYIIAVEAIDASETIRGAYE